MTSEVKYDLRNQLSDLDYLCYHVFLASICHHWELVPRRRTNGSQRYAHAGKNATNT